MNTNYFEKLEQIVDKLMEKHIPLSARNIEESKEILALCQYYKISRALAKQSEQQSNCNLPDVSGSLPSDEDVFKYARNITDDYTPSDCDHDSIFVFDRKTLFNIINFAKGKSK